MPTYDRFRNDVTHLQSVHPDVELHLVWTGPGEPVTVDLVRTLPDVRNRGLAEAALRDVTALADAWGVPLRLVVEPVRGDQDVDPARLIRWYTRHGFLITDARDRDRAPIMERPVSEHP
ncbi:GNAT family N-acetyltransferase [Actinomadura soli]|uniref:GNAT family N-acetyltransferase n=1 Tax=Actinomadura soli TaxID=2508997 RepID=A0A5C4JFB3_9ACTN|nr:GNAT family N-acetyltransferase [Actinomadura soli]TMR03406.1 GNAT family N-acetyltransferase [Actinomadura soli]